jgi:hypothetical protein
MSLSPCPTLTAASAHQRQHELRREATEWRVATRAPAAPAPRPAGNQDEHRRAEDAAQERCRQHSLSWAHRLSGAARRVEMRRAATCTTIGMRLVH